ncbi:TetR/AcrR family transcriptional regulator [uncultured Aeromicrobium sp.]|uniref:TetR/AcrR family transcriptional regulator n=1 Tax=uncultured Aeromicrobium sp. TaxID=337820 RepID=UPI0025E9F221|nr:TetR/AcrR family transcriptional regulator [uncultured Aeromicrobium sp.]
MTEQNPLARSHQLLWEGLPAPRKGPTPTLSLQQIVSTAISIADTEGIEALSMRRLATALGMGTMSLYRYIPSKSELLDLMLDHVLASQLGRLDPAGDWRDTLTTVAREGRALYLKHRWLLKVNWSRPVLGPNSVGEMEETMSGLKDLPFTDQEKMMVVTALDSYVTGSVRQEILYENAIVESGMSDEEFWGNQLPALAAAMESGKYPTMASLSEDVFDASWEENFEAGLRFMLDGIDREIERRTSEEAVE